MYIGRRQVLKGIGATLGALSLRGYVLAKEAAAHFTHGVASGDPLADRVIIWTRVLPGDGAERSISCRWEVAIEPGFKELIASGYQSARPEKDFTVKVDVLGLQPNQRYHYRFIAAGESSQIGRTSTLPVGELSEFKLGVASCSNYPQGLFHAYREMAKADLDIILHLGDYLYEYPVGYYVNPIAELELGRKVVPEHELVVLDDYRQRYGLYRSDPDLQVAHAAHPWITVWDDHEFTNDTWRLGAENHNEGEGDFAARREAARVAYHEWMPIRTSENGDQGDIYRTFEIGNLADLIMLDTRQLGRDEQLDYGKDIDGAGGIDLFLKNKLNASDRQLLGTKQEEWLADQLVASYERGATWQVLGQQVLMGKLSFPSIPAEDLENLILSKDVKSVIDRSNKLAPFGLPSNLDAWDGYPSARERLFKMLLASSSNPISLAGDTHNGWAFNLATDTGEAVGVEFGTPGITSPGLETYLPIPPEKMLSILKEASSELRYADTSKRGWTKVILTPEYATAQWQFVSSVIDTQYSTSVGAELKTLAGSRRLIGSS